MSLQDMICSPIRLHLFKASLVGCLGELDFASSQAQQFRGHNVRSESRQIMVEM